MQPMNGIRQRKRLWNRGPTPCIVGHAALLLGVLYCKATPCCSVFLSTQSTNQPPPPSSQPANTSHQATAIASYLPTAVLQHPRPLAATAPTSIGEHAPSKASPSWPSPGTLLLQTTTGTNLSEYTTLPGPAKAAPTGPLQPLPGHPDTWAPLLWYRSSCRPPGQYTL
jgi:hypothetical protein